MPKAEPKSTALAKARTERPKISDFLENPKVKAGLRDVAGKILTPEKMLRLTTHAIRKTPLLAACTPESVLGAMMIATGLSLEPNTPLGHCYFIPYRRRIRGSKGWYTLLECQFQMGYKGFITLAHRSPKLITLQAEAIHTKDVFERMLGTESHLRFQQARHDRGAIDGAFAYSKIRGEYGEGEISIYLPLDEVHKIRSKSETYRTLSERVEKAKALLGAAEADGKKPSAKLLADLRSAEQKLADTPWVLWEDTMFMKSAVKRLCGQFPLDPGMAAAAHIDNLSDAGRLDMAQLGDPEYTKAVIEGEVSPETQENGEAEEDPGEKEGKARIEAPPESEPAAEAKPSTKAKKAAPKPVEPAAEEEQEPPPAEEEPPPAEPEEVEPGSEPETAEAETVEPSAGPEDQAQMDEIFG